MIAPVDRPVEVRHQRARSAAAYAIAYGCMFGSAAVLVVSLVVIVLWLGGRL